MTKNHTPPSADDYVAAFRKMYFNGQKRLVIPRVLTETPGFVPAFNDWFGNIAACGENYLDIDDMSQWVCADDPGHPGLHFGGLEKYHLEPQDRDGTLLL